MLSTLVRLVMSFVFILVGTKEDKRTVDRTEIWQFSWCLSYQEWETNRKRDKVVQRVSYKRDKELETTFIEIEMYMQEKGHGELELDKERRRREYREWKKSCDQLFKPIAS